jgi:hypothetical protein
MKKVLLLLFLVPLQIFAQPSSCPQGTWGIQTISQSSAGCTYRLTINHTNVTSGEKSMSAKVMVNNVVALDTCFSVKNDGTNLFQFAAACGNTVVTVKGHTGAHCNGADCVIPMGTILPVGPSVSAIVMYTSLRITWKDVHDKVEIRYGMNAKWETVNTSGQPSGQTTVCNVPIGDVYLKADDGKIFRTRVTGVGKLHYYTTDGKYMGIIEAYTDLPVGTWLSRDENGYGMIIPIRHQ